MNNSLGDCPSHAMFSHPFHHIVIFIDLIVVLVHTLFHVFLICLFPLKSKIVAHQVVLMI